MPSQRSRAGPDLSACTSIGTTTLAACVPMSTNARPTNATSEQNSTASSIFGERPHTDEPEATEAGPFMETPRSGVASSCVGEQHQIANQQAGADGLYRAIAISDPDLGFVAVADADGDGPTATAACQLAADVVRAHVARNTDVLDRFRRHPTDDLRTRILGVLKDAILRADTETTALASRRSDELAVSFDAALLVGSRDVRRARRGRSRLPRSPRPAPPSHRRSPHGRGRPAGRRASATRRAERFALRRVAEPRARPGPEARGRDASASTRSPAIGSSRRIASWCFRCPTSRSATSSRNARAEELVPHLLELGRRAGTRGVACGCMQIAGSATKKERDARLEILGRMAMLAHCSPQELVAVASATRPRTYRAGDVDRHRGAHGPRDVPRGVGPTRDREGRFGDRDPRAGHDVRGDGDARRAARERDGARDERTSRSS